jgi:intracellular septation protein
MMSQTKPSPQKPEPPEEADKTDLLAAALEADPDAGFVPQEARTNWVKMAIDFGAPIAFALTYFILGRFSFADKDFPLLAATGVLVTASTLALIAGFIIEKRVAWMPLIVGIFALVFGGLTLLLHDTRIIKMKLTVFNAAFSLLLFGGLWLKKQPLKAVIGEAIRLKPEAWDKLSLYYALYFMGVAIANEIIWRTQAESIWVGFRASLFVVTIVFSLALAPFLMKNMLPANE